MHLLDEERAEQVRTVCEPIVPGCARVGPVVYIDALLAPDAAADAASAALAAIDTLGELADGRALTRSRERQLTPEFQLVRALAMRGLLQRLRGAGRRPGPGAWEEIDFHPPVAALLRKDWSYLGVARMSERFDVVVVGSGAGGGVVAGELAERGRSRAAARVGPHRTAADFTRWEAHADPRAVVADPLRDAGRATASRRSR